MEDSRSLPFCVPAPKVTLCMQMGAHPVKCGMWLTRDTPSPTEALSKTTISPHSIKTTATHPIHRHVRTPEVLQYQPF